MAGLQVLEDKVDDLAVLGFYSDDFGKQGGSDEQIKAASDKYSVTYAQFAIEPVSGAAPRPVFEWLFAQDNPGPRDALPPSWNFFKWLVSKEGKLVGAYELSEYPGEDPSTDKWKDSALVKAIEAQLG